MSGDCITAAHTVNQNLPTTSDSWDSPEWDQPFPFTIVDSPVPYRLPAALPYGGTVLASAPASYEPTLEEIREHCLQFQSGWSETERLRRERGIVCDSRKAVRS